MNDLEGDAVAWLRESLPELTIVTQRPDVWPSKLVLLTLLGGAGLYAWESSRVLGAARDLNVQTWANDQTVAHDTAWAVLDALGDMPGVSRCRVTSLPQSVPDPSAPEKYRHRYNAVATVLSR